MRPKHYYHEMYKMNFYFCMKWTDIEFEKYMLKAFEYRTNCKRSGGKTMLVESDQGHIIVVWTNKKEKGLSVLAHECVHAAMMTLDIRGINARNDDGEALAYLVEHLFNKALHAS